MSREFPANRAHADDRKHTPWQHYMRTDETPVLTAIKIRLLTIEAVCTILLLDGLQQRKHIQAWFASELLAWILAMPYKCVCAKEPTKKRDPKHVSPLDAQFASTRS